MARVKDVLSVVKVEGLIYDISCVDFLFYDDDDVAMLQVLAECFLEVVADIVQHPKIDAVVILHLFQLLQNDLLLPLL